MGTGRRYSLFDTVDHEWLMRFVEYRIGDQRVLRLIRRWPKAGVMQDGVLASTEIGTPQGAVVSPLRKLFIFYYYTSLIYGRSNGGLVKLAVT
jgi:RNA-directed DNA polymerase